MEINKCTKESFAVIGKEGSTDDGAGFIQKLWDDANSNFNEVQHLVKKDSSGNLCRIQGEPCPTFHVRLSCGRIFYLNQKSGSPIPRLSDF